MIHAQATLHCNPLNQTLRGRTQALVFFKISQSDLPGQQKSSHSLTKMGIAEASDGDGKWLGTTRNLHSPCCVPEGSEKKDDDDISASGRHILKPEEMHIAHAGGHIVVRSMLLGSVVLRSANESREHAASLEGTFGTLTNPI